MAPRPNVAFASVWSGHSGQLSPAVQPVWPLLGSLLCLRPRGDGALRDVQKNLKYQILRKKC